VVECLYLEGGDGDLDVGGRVADDGPIGGGHTCLDGRAATNGSRAIGGESVVGGGGERSVGAHGRSWRRVIARRRSLRATHCCASLARSHPRLCVRLEAMAGVRLGSTVWQISLGLDRVGWGGGGSTSWASPPRGERGCACTTMGGGRVVARRQGGGGGGAEHGRITCE
jgi:hypothetical protein